MRCHRDLNRDGSIGDVDEDGDGFTAQEERNDADGNINPDVDERGNGVDDNCDGEVDNDPIDAPPYFIDEDGDGRSTANPSCHARRSTARQTTIKIVTIRMP